MNILNAINNANQQLKEKGIKTYQLDTQILMSKAIKKRKEKILLNLEDEIEIEDYNCFIDLINQRLNMKPIAYLVGNKSFWKYDFKVTNDVLIPRPDTELIIEEVIKLTKNKSKLNVLDIGVGSGCIILSILKEKKDFRGTGIDISKKSLRICKINSINLDVSNRLKLYKSDVDNFQIGKYDLIVSNPPYIKKVDLKYLDKDVIGFEPRLALDGGLEGLSVIQKVIEKSSKLIKKNGILVLEIAFDQKKRVIEILKKEGFYIKKFMKDLARNDRCITAIKIK
jgi:release factor glutamine methyltransferase